MVIKLFLRSIVTPDDVVHRSDDRELPRVLPLAHAPLVQGLPRNPNPNPSTPPYPGARCLSVLVAHRPPVAVPEGGERAPGDEGHGFRCLAISAEALVLERGGSLLKRKRPARIDIPAAEAFAAAPAGSDGLGEVEAESARFSVYCKRGKRRLEMEDRHRAALDLRDDPQMAFFAIFDGHGGKKAAEFASENIGELIVEEVEKRGGESYSEIEEAVKIGYLKTDKEFLKAEESGGTCCVTALLRKGNLVISNAGDCRAVLSRAGKAEALTSDHRPSRADEKDRIENLGGYVDCYRGIWRVQGSLAVSRGIGDSSLKQWVIPEPETRTLKITPEFEFLILASDGLWDTVSNQEAVDIARPLCMENDKSPLLSACKVLANLSASRGSRMISVS
uniref:protein-serine/threonine phosphatase n=1 Tax=Ananas comosus var. bracteatus TaxID=296719 RepID=A0A6V7PD71_ANACO|nr:unnamed protein product [Ananas comosus var. bracteatus]